MVITEEPAPTDELTQAKLLADELVAALINSRIYALEHPRVQASLQSLRRHLVALADLVDRGTVEIGCIDGLLVFDRRPLLGASMSAGRLLGILKNWQAGGLALDRSATTVELQRLLTCLVARPEPGDDYQTLNLRLGQQQCLAARLLPPLRQQASANPSLDQCLRVGVELSQSIIDMLQSATIAVCRGGQIDFAPVQAQAEVMLRRLEDSREPLLGLARQEQYDAFTFGHSLRVALLSLHFARALTDDRDLLIRIGTAALLHDVGKSLIPFEILHSPRSLSPDERREMDRHAELGAECLLDHHDSDPLAIAAAFGHHRNPDGSGYPRTAHDHDVGLVTRIVKICDIFEALTAARPYKQPMSPIRAYRVMIAMGDKIDQGLLRRFIEVNGIYPVGQLVELDDGCVAVVRAQGSDYTRPKLAVLESAADLQRERAEEPIIDLADIACATVRRILRELTPGEAAERLNPR